MEINPLKDVLREVLEKLDKLLQQFEDSKTSGKDWDNTYLSVNELSDYLKIPVSTIYKKVDELPRYKYGKRLLFKKAEIDKILKSCRIASNSEIRAKALSSIMKEELDG